MIASLTKPVWTEEYETEILNKLAAQHAPYLLNLEKVETHPPETQQEPQRTQESICGSPNLMYCTQLITARILNA